MTNNDFFKFEDKNLDFPLYKNKTLDNRKNILLLVIPLILFAFLSLGPIKFSKVEHQCILFFVTLIPLLMITSGNIGTFFRKPSVNDIRFVIVSYIGYTIYYLFMAALLSFIHFQTTTGDVSGGLTLLEFITNILQIIGEELFRAFLFILCMYLLYKNLNNRKKSIVLSSIIVLLVFGMLHVNTYNYNIVQILIFQGLGSVFELFAYLKTKNLTLSVLIHILVDVSYWVMLLS